MGMAILCILCYPPIEAYQITGVVIGRGVLCEHVSLLYSSWFPDIAQSTARVTAPPQAGEAGELKGPQDSGLIRFSNKGVGLS